MRLLLALVIKCFILKCISAKIYTCFDGNVFLNYSEIAFYETPNFPYDLNDSTVAACNLTFILNGQITNTSKVFTSFVRPSIFSKIDYIFQTMQNSALKIRDTFSTLRDAQSGNVIFEENDENCPLESISRSKPFMLTSEDQILYIYSNFYFNQTRKHSCLWRFAAPPEFGFKIVVQTFSSKMLLRIKNSTDLLINENSVRMNYPHYNSDAYFEIYLSNNDPNFDAEIEFQAYVSIVQNNQKKNPINCSISQERNLTRWSNIQEGYENNVECSYDFVVHNNSVVIVEILVLQTEPNGDYLEYSLDNGDPIVIIPDPHGFSFSFVIEPYKDGSDKHVNWKFVSDGSVHFFGFSLEFQSIFCECTNQFIACGTNNFTLMNTPGNILFHDYYCGNMQCNVTIESCQSELTYVEIQYIHYREHYDIFRLISNNITILDVNRQNQLVFTQYLNSANVNIFQIITFSSRNAHGLLIKTAPGKEPKFEEKIIISENNRNVILNAEIESFIPIEIEKSLIGQNIFLVIYCLLPERIALYHNNSLTFPLDYCFTESSTSKCIIKEAYFVLNQVETEIVAITLSSSPKTCVFKNNYFVTENVDLHRISGIANNNGPCLLTIMPDYFYYITRFWTSATSDTVKVFVGIDQNTLFFEFKSESSKQWNDILLTSTVYTVVIPKSSAVFFTLEAYDREPVVSQYPYKSLMATPSYGINTEDVEDVAFTKYCIKEFPTKFTVLDYTFAVENLVYFFIGEDEFAPVIHINKTGDSLVLKNQNVTLYYTNDGNGAKNGALFLIEAQDNKIGQH